MGKFLYAFSNAFMWGVIAFVLLGALGCSPKTHEPTSKQEISVVGGFTKAKQGLKGAADYVERVKRTPLNERQEDFVEGIRLHVYAANEGVAEAEKACTAAVKENDSSRQGFYRWTDRASFIGGVALAIGLALIVMGVVNGQKLGLGVGVAVLGGSLTAVFLTIRSAAPVLPWVMAGVGALSVIGFGVLLWERLHARREKLKREAQLQMEQRATKELTETVDEVAKFVPEEVKPDLFKRISNDIQSSTTERLVKEAKNGGTPATDVKAAAEATVESAKQTVKAADAVQHDAILP